MANTYILLLLLPICIADRCSNCKYVRDGSYFQTNHDGKVIQTFRCSTNPTTRLFCSKRDSTSVTEVPLEPSDTCHAFHYIRYCFTSLTRTFIFGTTSMGVAAEQQAGFVVYKSEKDIFHFLSIYNSPGITKIFDRAHRKVLLHNGNVVEPVFASIFYRELAKHSTLSISRVLARHHSIDGISVLRSKHSTSINSEARLTVYESKYFWILPVYLEFQEYSQNQMCGGVSIFPTDSVPGRTFAAYDIMCSYYYPSYVHEGVHYEVTPFTDYHKGGSIFHGTSEGLHFVCGTRLIKFIICTHMALKAFFYVPYNMYLLSDHNCHNCYFSTSANYYSSGNHLPASDWVSVLTGCPHLRENPLTVFLDKPRLDANTCFRITTSDLTQCYSYSVSDTFVAPPEKLVSSTGVVLGALGLNYRLDITTSKSISSSVQPYLAIGTFRHSRNTTMAYLYEYQYPFTTTIDGIHISTQLPCKNPNVARDSIVYSQDCECVYEITPFICLCSTRPNTLVLKKTLKFTDFKFESPNWFVKTTIPYSYKPKVFITEVDTKPPLPPIPDCELFLCNNDVTCLNIMEGSPFKSACQRTTSLIQAQLSDISLKRDTIKNFTVSFSATSLKTVDFVDSSLEGPLFDEFPLTKELFVQAYQTVRALDNPLPAQNKPSIILTRSAVLEEEADYWDMDAKTGQWEQVGVSAVSHFLPGVGIGVVTSKINRLAKTLELHESKINSLIDNQDIIAQAIVEVQHHFNSLLGHLSDASSIQLSINKLIIDSIDNLASEFTAFVTMTNNNLFTIEQQLSSLRGDLNNAKRRLAFVENVSARMLVFNQYLQYLLSQYKSFKQSLESFMVRATYCTSRSVHKNPYPCLNKDGEVILSSLSVKAHKYKLTIVGYMPDESKTLFVTDSFCHEDNMFLARSGFVFYFCADNTLCSTPVEGFEEQNISNSNSIVIPGCASFELYLFDIVFEYDLPEIQTDSTLPYADLTEDDVQKIKMFAPSLYLNVTAMRTLNDKLENVTSRFSSLHLDILEIEHISKLSGSATVFVKRYSTIIGLVSLVFSTVSFIHVLCFCIKSYKVKISAASLLHTT